MIILLDELAVVLAQAAITTSETCEFFGIIRHIKANMANFCLKVFKHDSIVMILTTHRELSALVFLEL